MVRMEDYIDNISDRSLRIIAQAPNRIDAIQKLGGVPVITDKDTWRIDFDSENHLAKIIQTLRDAEFAFAGWQGWPPASIAEWLRGKGKIHGDIRVMLWIGPGKVVIEQR